MEEAAVDIVLQGMVLILHFLIPNFHHPVHAAGDENTGMEGIPPHTHDTHEEVCIIRIQESAGSVYGAL